LGFYAPSCGIYRGIRLFTVEFVFFRGIRLFSADFDVLHSNNSENDLDADGCLMINK